MNMVADTIIVLIMCISSKGMPEKADTTFLNRETISEMRIASEEASKSASDKCRLIKKIEAIKRKDKE